MAFALFGTGGLEFGDGAATGRPEEQKRTAVRGSHLPELGPEAVVIGVGLSAALPGELIDFGGGGAEALNLQIELHGLLEALASLALAAAGSGAAEEGGEGEGEEEEEGEEVGEGEGGEEEGEGVEDVAEVGGEEEGAGEEDQEED